MAKIISIAPLDWPSSPSEELPTTTILCGGPSYIAHQSRYHSNTIPWETVAAAKIGSASQKEEERKANVQKMASSSSSSAAALDKQKKKKAAIDLTTLKQSELDDLSYYDILGGIEMHSSPEQIKRAFHKACLKYHPDKEEDKDHSKESKNSKNTNDDPIFLKVKEAFETLSDAVKRKGYDSTIDFDESIPSVDDIDKEQDFYTIFGNCFEINLRFAAENDPDRILSSPNGSKKGKRNKKNNNNNNKSSSSSRPELGDETTPISDVNRFYDYWIHFESWRDFTLVATKLTEHDTDMAECRYEKRWMEKEITRLAKSMKKDEMARINKLVERAMALDPRLKREKERVEKEKQEKKRLKKEQMEREERERREREETEAREKKRLEEEQKAERVRIKAKKEQEKKVLRKARQALRKLILSMYEKNPNAWETFEIMNNDLELLCEKMNAVQINEFVETISSSEDTAHISITMDKVNELQDENLKKTRDELKQREARRLQAMQRQEAAKAARAAKPWTKEELAALAKAVKKYPAGGANRWETISLFVNNLCRLQDPRTKEECIEKYNQTANSAKPATNGAKPAATKGSAQKPAEQAKTNGADAKGGSSSSQWTDEQNKQLQAALSKYPASMDKNERWTSIAKAVPGKNKKDCVNRFKAIRLALKNKT